MQPALPFFVSYVVKFLPFYTFMAFRSFILGCLLLPLALRAQQFVPPSKVATGLTVAIEIKDQKDLDFVKNNLQKLYGVQRVRVNGPVDIHSVAAVLELLDDVQDVQLLKFSGDLNEQDLLKLEWVENVTLYLRNGKEDQILMNDNLGMLNGLTLIFEVVPEDYYFIESLKKIKSLTLIAPFVAKEAAVAVQQASTLKQLTHFGISLDKLTDLPASVRSLPKLESITVIDNLSFYNEKYLENLSVLRRNLEYTENGKLRHTLLEYLASDVELMPWDWKHIHTLFPDSRFAPIANASGDTTTIGTFADFVPLRKVQSEVFAQHQAQAPIIGLQEGEFLFQGSTEEDAIYYLGKDAAILIPKLSMRTARDTQYRGFYTLKCTWLNSPSTYFEHGLNLNFDSSRKHYQLAPSGLLDIAATAGKDILDLKEGYFIKVVFLQAPDTARRFYAWNSRTSKWENYYDYDYRFDDTKIAPIDFYNFYGGKKTAKETFGLDKSAAEWRFETEGYFYLLEPGQNRVSLENYNGYWVAPVTDRAPKMGAYTLKRGKSLIGLKKEYVDKRSEQGIVKFQIYDKTETLFPELKAFKDYVFEIATALSPKDFSAAFIRGAVYSDVRIEQLGAGFVMELRSDEGYWRLNIQSPAEKYKKGSAKARSAEKEFLRRFQKYSSVRAAREMAFSQYMNNLHNNYVAQTKAALFGSSKTKGSSAQDFKIRSMGAYTWAMPVELPDTFQLVIRFTDEGGIPLDVKAAWIAHGNPFNYTTFGASENYNCTINPKELQYLVCVDYKDRVFILTAADFRLRNIRNNSLVYLAMNSFPANVKNSKELLRVLGMGK